MNGIDSEVPYKEKVYWNYKDILYAGQTEAQSA